MDGVLRALEELVSDDLHAQSSPDLLERTRDLVEVINRAQAELARTVRVADSRQAFAGDGMVTAQSWLRGHCRLSNAAASQVVRNGRVMAQLPAVAEGHPAGALTADQVAVIGRITGPRPAALAAAQGVDLPGVAAVLAGVAAAHKHDELVRLVHAVLERLDADGPQPDPTEERFLTFGRHADGSGTGRFHLDAMGTEKLCAALESVLQATRPAGDERTVAQRQADALVQLADIHLGCGTLPLLRTVKPHVAVRVDRDDLSDPGTGRGAGRMGFSATISAARARWAARDADLARYILGPDGVPLDHGRTRRLLPPEPRRAVALRDGHCVFAGGDAPTHWCEVHHVIHWLFGGQTSLENSGLLCERHHTRVHHGFGIQRDPTGRWHTYRPDGTEILLIRPATDDPEPARAG